MNGVAGRMLVIRHGQTGGNKNRYVGWEDEPLDAVGREQAHALARLLAAERIDAVYASPLSRARDTAHPLAAQLGLSIRVRDDLKEIDYGECQGRLKAERPLRLRHEFRFAPLPGGESLFDVFRRIERLCAEFREGMSAGRNVAVVGHFWSNRMLVGALMHVPFEELFSRTDYKPANGSVYELQCQRGATGSLRVAAARWLVKE